MAWIESNQTLANHPKTLKLSRLLNVPRVTAVGHLHFLWWWALDYAQDGDLGKFDELDIAVAADWQGEPSVLWDALKQAGFVDDHGTIHDWNEYTGRLIERRRADAERKRDARSKGVQRPSVGHPEDGVRNRTVPNQTQPNQTEPDDNARAARDAGTSKAVAELHPNTSPHGELASIKPHASDPYAAWAGYCQAAGLDITAATETTKGRALAATKRLLEAGNTVDEIAACTAYLCSQSWRTSIVSLKTVEQEIGPWKMARKPARERARAPNGLSTQSVEAGLSYAQQLREQGR